MQKKITGISREAVLNDLLRGSVLVLVTIFLWCAQYDRWTVASWQTPIIYLGDPVKGDALLELGYIRGASDGHISPVFSNLVPELGAPLTGNWNDYPLPEKPLIMATGWLARVVGLFAAANVALLGAFVLAAVSFFATARLLRCSWVWAFSGALVFAFSRYTYAQGLHHLTIVYYWQVVPALVVCQWMLRGDGIKIGGWQFVMALLVAGATAAQNVYYTYLFVQFVVLAGLVQTCRGGWKRALPAAAVLATAAGTFLFMNLNTIRYALVHGPGDAVVRKYAWLEVYGLKLADMVIPPPDHVFPPFAAWGQTYVHEVLLSPGELPPTAYLGLAGLGALGWLVVVSWRAVVRRSSPPLEAFMILWIIVFAGVGGVNGVIGSLGFQMIRSTTRYSIVVLALVLLFAVRRLSLISWTQKSPWVYPVAALVTLFAFWDQSPPAVTDREIADEAARVMSDRGFTEALDDHLPAGAAIFQLPVMDYPDSPARGVGAYEHFRPYLYARHLRFSYGSDRGRPEGEWQHQMATLPLDVMLDELAIHGFVAIYINRNGYADQGDRIVKDLENMGYAEKVESPRGDLVCVFLKKG